MTVIRGLAYGVVLLGIVGVAAGIHRLAMISYRDDPGRRWVPLITAGVAITCVGWLTFLVFGQHLPYSIELTAQLVGILGLLVGLAGAFGANTARGRHDRRKVQEQG